MILQLRIILQILCLVITIGLVTSCAEKKQGYDYVDVMKSDVLTDQALGESWRLLTDGQKLADAGTSKDDIIKTFPVDTKFSTNTTSIIFFIEGSIPMIIELDRNNKNKKITKGGGRSVSQKTQNLPLIASNTMMTKSDQKINYDDVIDVVASDRNDEERQKKKALIIAPYNATDFKNEDDADAAYKYLKKNKNYKDDIVFLKNNLTLEDFASFGEYDLVHLSTHGQNYCELKKTTMNNGWVFIKGMPSTECVLTIETNIKHGFTDLRNDETQRAEARKIYGKYKGLFIIDDESISLRNAFFSELYNGLENKIWVFSACELGSNNFFEATINNIHTNGHFIYWLNEVNTEDAYKACDKFYDFLINKGLDVSRAFDEIPKGLRENLPSTVSYTITKKKTVYKTDPITKEKLAEIVEKDITVEKEATTRLMHLQTDAPRHGIEIIEMLHPENNKIVEKDDFYPLIHNYKNTKKEALTLKIELLGYTIKEFEEQNMRVSLRVDGKKILNKKAFLPELKDDDLFVETIADNKYGVHVTFKNLLIPDVGKKKHLSLKAILHLNDKHFSIHQERVSIYERGITATLNVDNESVVFIYDDKRKAEMIYSITSPDEKIYFDGDGYIYGYDKEYGWVKGNLSVKALKSLNMDLGFLDELVDSFGVNPLNFPIAGLSFFIKRRLFSNLILLFKKEKYKCGVSKTCYKYVFRGQEAFVAFDELDRLSEINFGKSGTIKYEYGSYNVILPNAKDVISQSDMDKFVGEYKKILNL